MGGLLIAGLFFFVTSGCLFWKELNIPTRPYASIPTFPFAFPLPLTLPFILSRLLSFSSVNTAVGGDTVTLLVLYSIRIDDDDDDEEAGSSVLGRETCPCPCGCNTRPSTVATISSLRITPGIALLALC